MNNGTSKGNSIDDTLKELDLDTIINEGETNGNQESNADADVDTGMKLPPPNIQETQTKDESEVDAKDGKVNTKGNGETSTKKTDPSLDFDKTLEELGGFEGIGGNVDFDAQLAKLHEEEKLHAQERKKAVTAQ